MPLDVFTESRQILRIASYILILAIVVLPARCRPAYVLWSPKWIRSTRMEGCSRESESKGLT